ncbi:MAG: UDP-N-acetylglucosamine 2-epimerase [Candidatus Rifleibacteriota bacterium]
MKRKIAVITGSRAEWGILKHLWFELKKHPAIEEQLIVTGSHFDENTGYSIKEIVEDKVEITAEVKCTKSKNSEGIFYEMGDIFKEFPEILGKLNPDIAVVLGDRYEVFAVAAICRLSGTKLAHISGGEITQGAFDDCLRHSITKMADVHFTANKEYRQRVIQLGEQPETVFNVGDPGLYKLSEIKKLDRKELEADLNISLNKNIVLATFHPETCSLGLVSRKLPEVIDCLLKELPENNFIFTAANSDPEGVAINDLLMKAANKWPQKIKFFKNLGRRRYLSLAAIAQFVAGNSSSGIIEIPSLKVPVINFGDRQKGRPHGIHVIDVKFEKHSLRNALKLIEKPEFIEKLKKMPNIYEGENSIDKIVEILVRLDFLKPGKGKSFYDIGK